MRADDPDMILVEESPDVGQSSQIQVEDNNISPILQNGMSYFVEIAGHDYVVKVSMQGCGHVFGNNAIGLSYNECERVHGMLLGLHALAFLAERVQGAVYARCKMQQQRTGVSEVSGRPVRTDGTGSRQL